MGPHPGPAPSAAQARRGTYTAPSQGSRRPSATLWPLAPMDRTGLERACPEARLTAAAAWLAARGEPRVTVVGASLEVASDVARRAVGATPRGAAFGWERTTLGMLAASLARPELA